MRSYIAGLKFILKELLFVLSGVAVVACLILLVAFGNHLASPLAERLVLDRHYSNAVIQQERLRLVKTHPQLIVSNGEQLPDADYHFHSDFVMGAGLLFCGVCIAAIWIADHYLFRGNVWGFLSSYFHLSKMM